MWNIISVYTFYMRKFFNCTYLLFSVYFTRRFIWNWNMCIFSVVYRNGPFWWQRKKNITNESVSESSWVNWIQSRKSRLKTIYYHRWTKDKELIAELQCFFPSRYHHFTFSNRLTSRHWLEKRQFLSKCLNVQSIPFCNC